MSALEHICARSRWFSVRFARFSGWFNTVFYASKSIWGHYQLVSGTISPVDDQCAGRRSPGAANLLLQGTLTNLRTSLHRGRSVCITGPLRDYIPTGLRWNFSTAAVLDRLTSMEAFFEIRCMKYSISLAYSSHIP